MGYDKLVTLAERCAKYVAACGKKSILETKPIGKVDVSKLGVCLSDGTVYFPKDMMIRYKTAKEAEAQAKKVVMKQYEAPFVEQKELNVAFWNKDFYNNTPVSHDHSCPPDVVNWTRHTPGTINMVHNHPASNAMGDTVPLSGNDIQCFIMNDTKSITALNQAGEYNTAIIVDRAKAIGTNSGLSAVKIGQVLIKEQYPYMMGKDGKQLLKLRRLAKKQKLTPELEIELKNLENKLELFGEKGYLEFAEKHPNEFARILHRSYQRILPQYGIEYKTNFSNLLKYDA